MLALETNNPEINYSPTRISGGGGSVSMGNIAQQAKREVYPNTPKIWEPPQNSRRQNNDMKQVPHR